MKLLKRFVCAAVPERLDEELRVQDVLPQWPFHRSASGDANRMPSIARVPSISLRWNTTRSSARSMVSVAVAAPSARFAALNFDSGSR